METIAAQENNTISWFDSGALHTLGADIPSNLEIWRLRLRFGLPKQITAGKLFRVAIDLVDEMGQPPTIELEKPKLLIQLKQTDCVNTETSQSLLHLVELPNASRTRWTFDVAIKGDPMNYCLMIKVDSNGEESQISRFHKEFQRFCVHSTWVDNNILVLPLESDRIQVADSSVKQDKESVKSTICRRMFCVADPNLSSPKLSQPYHLLTITENYGDAMGAHVWDASIFLSFALIEARKCSEFPIAMMELGAGCGLFGSIFRMLYRSQSPTMVLTERPESIPLLQSNLVALDEHEDEHTVAITPLIWGHLPLPDIVERHFQDKACRIVFAADVLYFWEAHAALLATLEALAASNSGLQAIIAHKHRGIATSKALEEVLSASDKSSPVECKKSLWDRWKVERLAQLGRVDLLRFTRRI